MPAPTFIPKAKPTRVVVSGVGAFREVHFIWPEGMPLPSVGETVDVLLGEADVSTPAVVRSRSFYPQDSDGPMIYLVVG